MGRVVAAGPGALLAVVPLAPVLDAKRRFRGFRIVRIHDNSPEILAYGVHPGDMVVSVNGIRIVRPDHMLALFKRIGNATELDLRLTRAGRAVRVRVPIVDEP